MMTAIFLLVVIAVLAGYIVSLSNTQHTSATLDFQGARAYQAAYAGMQWGVHRALNGAACAGSMLLSGDLAGFAATVACTPFPYSEGGAAGTVYRIVSTGCSPPAAGACPGTAGNYYVERQIEVTLDQ